MWAAVYDAHPHPIPRQLGRERKAHRSRAYDQYLMRVLYRKKPTPPSQLADQMGLTRGAVIKLADRLVAKALIVREASPDDGRSQTLSLTAKGMDFVPELAALADQNDAECFAHLSDAERRALERILKDAVRRFGLTSMPIE